MQVTRYHHQPTNAVQNQFEVAIVHIADILVSSVPFGHNGDQHVPPLDEKAWQLLGLDPDAIPPLIMNVKRQLAVLTTLMRPEN